MKKKETTPMRKIRRNYEERHQAERKASNITWGTSISREDGEEINAFLEKYGISKVSLIYTGFVTLKERYEKTEKTDKH